MRRIWAVLAAAIMGALAIGGGTAKANTYDLWGAIASSGCKVHAAAHSVTGSGLMWAEMSEAACPDQGWRHGVDWWYNGVHYPDSWTHIQIPNMEISTLDLAAPAYGGGAHHFFPTSSPDWTYSLSRQVIFQCVPGHRIRIQFNWPRDITSGNVYNTASHTTWITCGA